MSGDPRPRDVTQMTFLVLSLLIIKADETKKVPGCLPTVWKLNSSFYGSSYIHVPLQDARSTTEIQFRFKTKRSDSFLLLAAGRTDYCLLRLESGKLKVHINLGAGESEVSSARGLKLDDLSWHQVTIKRTDADLVLTIDNLHITKEKLPGRFFELNIHYGIFLGGQGDFSELFLGHHDALRGCLSDVLYNGINVLKKARERNGSVDVHGVTWTCSPEFEAGVDRDLSFIEDGAFMSLANPIARTGARWELEVKTAAENGLLLYNTGVSSRSDYVGVEIVDKHLRLLVDKGNGATELISDATVADGEWHAVVVHFSPSFMEISVDRRTSTLQLAPGGNRFLDLGDILFLGGMELNKRARALGQGIKAADLSLKGCFRNMSFDGKRTGLTDARTTQGLLPECVWKFPCLESPCVAGAPCKQVGVEGFQCDCEQHGDCVKSEYKEKHKMLSRGTSSLDLEIVKLVPVLVEEGKNALITAENIDVVLDYRKYGVRDSGLLIHIVNGPEHGKVAVDNWEKRSAGRQVFTMLDIAKDKVRYLHDGSENHHDTVIFDLELSPEAGFVPPSYLQGRHRFTLHVNVTPVNDPPTLIFGPGKVLRLAQGTRKVLTGDLLQAEDADNPSSDLVYTVLHQGAKGEEKGYVERIGQPGVKVDTFTQREVESGAVAYVHRGKEGVNNRLALQVSDGVETSAPAFLRVTSFPLQLRLINNSGVVLTHHSSIRITPANLSFATNADDPNLEIRFDVTSAPQYGVIQRLRPGDGAEGVWQAVETFTSMQIAREQVRYLHTSGAPTQDFFKFKVGVMQVMNPTVYDFRLTFTKLVLEAEKVQEVLLNGTKDVTITENELKFITKPLSTPKKDIVYKILKGPKYGFLNLLNNKRRHLQGGDVFTQEDIENERLRYRLHRKGYSHIKDDFIFQAAVPDAESPPKTLALIHTPTQNSKNEVQVTLERLQVDEGGRRNLLPTHLDLRASVITSLAYNITHGPSHGRLEVTDSRNNVARKNTTHFTSQELISERVFYCHDDSETKRDRFNFIAFSSEEEDFQFVGIFHVDVMLKNDNSPVRTINKVFNVVTKGEKLLTGKDLEYSDADIDTKLSDIVYTRRGIPNGGLYSAANPTKAVFDFTQEDLDSGRILFRHEGDEYGKIGLWITDGKFFDNGALEVKASPPYVVLVNHTHLVVRHGGSQLINSQNLAVETNLNTGTDRIIYEVLEGPGHGYLMVLPQAEPLDKFSQFSLDQGRLSYNHDGSPSVKDFFRFRVNAQGATTEAMFEIRIYPASFWEELIVAHNRTLYVEESTSVLITMDDLEVMHPSIAPSDVTFFVIEEPKYGTLEIDPSPGSAEPKDESKLKIEAFEQSTINDKRLRYVQEIANQTNDHFMVDVSNGITWLRGLTINLTVIPEVIYILGGEISCLEGQAATLPSSLLSVHDGYYQGKVADYKVTQKPAHGSLRLLKQLDIDVNKFTAPQLESNQVQYVHDGSESLADSFVVVGRAGDKESVPATVHVVIQAINDQPPVVVNNTGLELWEGSSAIITSSNLAAVDEDTPAENLTYTISSVKTGLIALVTNPNKAVQGFTQAQINNNQILFLQTGGQLGSFQFQISDGENLSKPGTFTLTAKQVEITLTKFDTLHVFPMLGKPITPAHLLAVTSDHTTSRGRSLSFHVKSPPSMGKLVIQDLNGGVIEVESFTQKDVNESRLWYQHMHRFNGLTARDSFVFDASAEFTKPLLNQEFEIVISVSSGGLDQFVDITPLVVREGEQQPVRINMTRLAKFLESEVGVERPELQLQLVEPPAYGDICTGNVCNSTILSSDVVYRHDDSDTTSDSIQLAIYLHPDVQLCNITCPVTIIPVNDQVFKLVTLSPYLTVVQGQSHTFTERDLCTEDEDTPPSNITYEVVSGPSQGFLWVSGNRTSEQPSKIRFSQEDVNAGRVVYYHTGLLQPTSFYFRVWDGHFNPTYTVFNIHVLPLTINATSYFPVVLQQCSSVTVLTPDHITVMTNGELENVKYNVTRSPQFGVIYLEETPANFFTQEDLAGKRVMYMQVDMMAAGDTFQLAAWIIDTEKPPTVDLNVVVKPLVIVGNFNPIIGLKNRLGVSALDASPLAKVTNSNPIYEITRKTRLGRLKKIIRSSGEKKNVKEKEITRFSHEELKSGVIYYVIRKSIIPDEYHGMEDSFQIQVQGAIFQPARLDFKFKVYPEGTNVSTTTLGTMPLPPRLPGPKSPVGHEGGVSIASPNIKKDYIVIVGVVLGVLVLASIVIIVIRCRTVKRQQKKDKSELQGPMPLPRPPDDLLPSSPRIKRFPASNGSTPSSLPQCKVIPLGPVDSIASSDVDINARYPYGMSDDPTEDWSSYDASEGNFTHRTANPMLRRNQYWV